MRNLIIVTLMAIAAVLALKSYRTTEQPKTLDHAPKSYLGREYADPDRWQAQTQKKEESLFCPPICPDLTIATVQKKGRWSPE